MGTKETALSLKMQYPKDYVSFSRGFSSSHLGVDMAWNSNYGGQSVPVYAPADGTVVTAVDGKGNTWGTSDHGYGNYVMVEHAKGVRTLMAHLKKGSVCVKVGQLVKRGQTLGIQNNSGYSNGTHVHLEVRLDGTRVNPVDYLYAYPNQIVNASSEKEFGIKRYTPTTFVGTPVERNSKVDQIKVLTNTLRARSAPNLQGKINGYIRTGIYDVHGITDADGYTWYNVEEYWIANNASSTYCTYLPKTEPKYALTMLHLNSGQKDAMVAWCKGENVEYNVVEE